MEIERIFDNYKSPAECEAFDRERIEKGMLYSVKDYPNNCPKCNAQMKLGHSQYITCQGCGNYLEREGSEIFVNWTHRLEDEE